SRSIAPARRLGAIVEAYDTRAVVAEQVQSLGARFVTLDLDAGDAQDAGGYAEAPTAEVYQPQRQESSQRERAELGKKLAHSDVVVTTALVPGQRAPILIDEAAVRGMKPGSVIVDLASEDGGNWRVRD